ncbi:response regulator [bacterium]|nr:response regulator [bacterium]
MSDGDKIRAVIVDDEVGARDTLISLLGEYCPEVEVAGIGRSVASGVQVISSLKPDLVFLDVDMSDGFGFDVLKNLPERNFGVVFTTAYSTYAAKAFEFAAIHYLLKPIEIAALMDSVARFKQQRKSIQTQQIEVLEDNFHAPLNKISLTINDEILVFDLDTIAYFSSNGGNTFAHFEANNHLVPQSLNYFEELLVDKGFYRSHAKFLLNLSHVVRFVSQGRNGFARLKSGAAVQISARRRPEFIRILRKFNTPD